MTQPLSLEERLDRVESQLAIQQLPARYALAVDSRDLDAWVGLFVADVDCGRRGRGREVLKQFIAPAVRTFYRSVHQVCGHVIDFVDRDHASGTVYCHAEHEDGGTWVAMAIVYFDRYERRDGRWYFVQRRERHWYSSDVLARPGDGGFQNWPRWAGRNPELPQAFPTWTPFWAATDQDELRALTREP